MLLFAIAARRIKPPIASSCFIAGHDWTAEAVGLLPNSQVDLKIVTHKTNGGDEFTVDVHDHKGKAIKERSITDCHDGSYCIRFCTNGPGVHTLTYVLSQSQSS